jgi:non-ribosomal peptide synthase protein (TIGR01720 family)
VVDGVSWRVLVEDLLILLGDPEAPLAAKTASFRDWARHLVEQTGQEDALAAERAYWLERTWRTPDPLPMERDEGRGADTVGTAGTQTVFLERSALRGLLDTLAGLDSPGGGLGLQDVLLAAAVETLCRWTGKPDLLVEIERHGREPVFGNIDLSRTVGYFTAAYPVLLQLSAGTAVERIRAIGRALCPPRTGTAYGLLRFLHPDPAVRARLGALPRPQLRFNYLGRFDTLLPPGAPVSFPDVPAAPGRSPRALRDVPLELNALTVDAGLRIDWSWSGLRHRGETMAALGQEIIDTVLRLSRELAEGRGAHASHPLTGMQSAMLYASSLYPEARPYQHQLEIDLLGEIEPGRLAAAWDLVVARHEVLRTRFRVDSAGRGVARTAPDGPRLRVVDLSAAWDGEVLARIAREDLERGFQLDREPALRVTLAGAPDRGFRLILTHHQVALDGWSVALLLEDWLRTHERLLAGGGLPGGLAGEPPRFRSYVEWLRSRPDTGEAAFWRRKLADLPPLPWTDGRLDAAPPSLADLDVLPRTLSEETTAALVGLARRNRLTLSTLVAGAWALAAAGWSGGSEVIFGMTVSGRPPELAGSGEMLGLFINAVPVRVAVPADARTLAWLQELQAELAALREQSYTSVAELRRHAGLPPDRLLFDSVLVFENYPVDRDLDSFSLRLEVLRSVESSDLPLTALVAPGPALRLELSADRRRIPEDQSREIADRWAEVLERLAREPDSRLLDLLPGPAPEAMDLLAGFSDEL